MRFLCVLGIFFLMAFSASSLAQNIVFPYDPAAVIDVKRDLGAKGDGVHDDTDALQKGIDLSCGIGTNQTKILYIPNGKYRITRTLVVKSGIGPWIYGQSKDKTIIKLEDGLNIEAVLRTHPRDRDPGSADWFMRTIRNLTIDVGNNPSTDGIRFFSNNSGEVKDVIIKGSGKVGINMGFMELNGPNMVQDVLIEGFEKGIVIEGPAIWGNTLSRIRIRNCKKIGLEIRASAVGVENLLVENTPLPVLNDIPQDWFWWGGVLAIVGGKFRGGNPEGPAILNRSVLYARDIEANGFKMAIESNSPMGNAPGLKIAEYTSHEVKRLYDEAPSRAMRLPIKLEPDIPWERNPSNWVCANDFGAVPGDNKDDTEAIQKAIDYAATHKKTVVYLRGIGGPDPNWYTLDGTVKIYGSVRLFIGMGFGRIIGGGKFIIDEDSAAVVKFENIQAFGGHPPIVENRSKDRVLWLENCDLKVVGTGKGDIFLTNCPSHIQLLGKGQSLWARQLNPEGDSDTGLVENLGGNLWILGMKFEGKGIRVRTAEGGKTEIFGVFNYGPGIPPDDNRPMFDIDNAKMCIMALREISFDGTYPVKVRERRGKETREYRLKPGEHGWIGWALYSGW
ncbi:hypothetical protein H5T87_02070 [bacterium]|nr:hypothetical protein [bacterium]